MSAVLVISSFVVRGGVGLRAAFALERLGHRVWSVPTVVLPHHPGHGRGTRIVPPAADFAALLDDLARTRWLGEIDAVVSGYLGEAAQAGPIAALVSAVKAANPSAFYLCDPVCGDGGRLYAPEATAAAIRDTLLPLADAATPNVTELAILSGAPADDPAAMVEAARRLGPATVLVTSAPALMRQSAAVALVTQEGALVAEHPLVEGAPNGPGDLFSALYTARRLEGRSPEETLTAATAGTFEAVARSVRARADEILLSAEQDAFVQPAFPVAVRRLAAARKGETS